MSDSESVKVLIVDEHELVAESFQQTLDGAGIEVVGIATSAAAALDQALQHEPDVVLMGYGLADHDGVNMASTIRARRPGIKVLMLISGDSSIVLDTTLDAGFAGHMEKTNGQSLRATIRSVARGDFALSSKNPRRPATTPRRSQDRWALLTRRETQVLDLIAEGLSNQVIAERLTVSLNTIRTHVQNITRKLGAHSKLEAVVTATRQGFLAR